MRETMSVKEAADHLLEVSGLMDVLSKYGKPVPVGSYRMNLMAWEDLDISMAGPMPDAEQYRRITQEVEAALRPCFNQAEWLPGNNRCSLGIETFRTGRRWSVDICWRSEADIAETLRRNDEMARLARECPEIGCAILEIKRGLIARGQYGFDKAPIHFHSPEIYAAVVEKGARSLKDFLALCLD